MQQDINALTSQRLGIPIPWLNAARTLKIATNDRALILTGVLHICVILFTFHPPRNRNETGAFVIKVFHRGHSRVHEVTLIWRRQSHLSREGKLRHNLTLASKKYSHYNKITNVFHQPILLSIKLGWNCSGFFLQYYCVYVVTP